MQVVLEATQKWATENKMKINPQKTKDMWICFSNAIPEPAPLVMDSVNIERVSSYKLLGVWHQDNLKWNRHAEEMVKKANKRIFSLRECRTAKLPREVNWPHVLSDKDKICARIWSCNLGRSARISCKRN